MDRELIKQLDDFIKVRLNEKRYRHTMGVVETASKLAERYGADTEKAYVAALFHDACKNLDIDEMNSLVEKYHIGEVYIDKPQLAHSKLAAAILKDRFGIDDEDILNAISYHTTGRAEMSLRKKSFIYLMLLSRTVPIRRRRNSTAWLLRISTGRVMRLLTMRSVW